MSATDVVNVLPLSLALFHGREYLVLNRSESSVRLAALGWKAPGVGWERDGWWVRDVHPRTVTRFERVEYDARFRGMPVEASANPFGGVEVWTTNARVAEAARIPTVNRGEYALRSSGWFDGLDAQLVRRTQRRFVAGDLARPRGPHMSEAEVEELVAQGRPLDAFAERYALGATTAMLQSDLEDLLDSGTADSYLDALTRLSLAVALDVRDEYFAKAASAAELFHDDVAVSFLLASRDASRAATDNVHADETARALANILTNDAPDADARAFLDGRDAWAFELVGIASLRHDIARGIRRHPRLPDELVNPYARDRVRLEPARVPTPPFPSRTAWIPVDGRLFPVNYDGTLASHDRVAPGADWTPRNGAWARPATPAERRSAYRNQLTGTYRGRPADLTVTPHGFLAVTWLERPAWLGEPPREPGHIDVIVPNDDAEITWRVSERPVPDDDPIWTWGRS